MADPAASPTWARAGWHLERALLGEDAVAELRAWVDEVGQWAVADGPGMHHLEATDHGPVPARTEDLVGCHERLAQFITTGVVPDLVGSLMGEAPVLYKEKINYKHPGGGGFAPHQDATAYRFVDYHVSVMVPVDSATVASGCLYVGSQPATDGCSEPSHPRGPLTVDDRGRIAASVADSLRWEPVEVQPGDVLVFDSYVPHRSDTNTTDVARRALYLTYNRASAGDHRERYYRDKAAEFAAADGTFGGDRVRISISDDFLGRPVL
jgi:ectoine hydroxylase-related dioxygenase (phytanoyl-CoA dioxygenase family)